MDVDDKLTVIYSAADSLQARYLQNLLEQEGIPSTVINEPVAGAAFTYPLGWATAPRVLVPLEYAEAARRIALEYDEVIRTAALTDFGDDTAADAPTDEASRAAAWPVCPGCGKRRSTECPTCGTADDDFPCAEVSAAFLGQTVAIAGGEADAAAEDEPPSKRPWLLCSTCDETFQPQYKRRCACGHDFGAGREEPAAAVREGIELHLLWFVAGLAGVGIAVLLYFAYVLSQ